MQNTTENTMLFTTELVGLKERKKVHVQLVKKGDAFQRCREVLNKMVDGAAIDRDTQLVEYTKSLRKKILVLKQKWLPQKVMLEQPLNLFWVEGTSTSILHNYIPRGQHNVYQVAYTQPLMNLTRVRMLLNWASTESVYAMSRCKFICEKTQIFTETDLVYTQEAALYEKHRARIEFFANKYLK